MNVELAELVYKQIKAHPELHRQGTWLRQTECGTTGCFAGWTVLLGDPTAKPMWFGWQWLAGNVQFPDGREIHVADYAAELLGLDEVDADLLFWAGNDVDHLREILDELIAQGDAR